MDKKEELNQLMEDLNKVMSLFKKMEDSSLDDIDSLREESTSLSKELKKRYGEENPT